MGSEVASDARQLRASLASAQQLSLDDLYQIVLDCFEILFHTAATDPRGEPLSESYMQSIIVDHEILELLGA